MNATDNYLGLSTLLPIRIRTTVYARVIYEHALLYYIYFTTARYYMVVLLVYYIYIIYREDNGAVSLRTPFGHPPPNHPRGPPNDCVYKHTHDDERVIRVRRKVISAQGAIRIIMYRWNRHVYLIQR